MEMNTGPFTIALRKDARIAPTEVSAVTAHDEIPFQISGHEGHIALYMNLGVLPMRKVPSRWSVGVFVVARAFVVSRVHQESTVGPKR
jgi:hypothetical protein